MFQIMNVAVTPHAVWPDYDGKPHVFETGTQAAEFCARENYYYSNPAYKIKLQPRRVADDGSWKERERARFASGEYVALPWVGQAWFDAKADTLADLFAHVSTADGAKIAYTEDGAKGMADRQTRVKPGKFLAKYFPELATEEVARLSVQFSKVYEDNVLMFATDADQWEHVYTNGPHSCMAHRANHYLSSIHPVRVYAGPDLQLAYLERNGVITARAIVWPAKQVFGRIYGDEARLADLLQEAGYKEGALDGARILRIEEGNGFVMPYVDYVSGARDAGDYLIIGEGRLATDNTNGLTEETPVCSCCDGCVHPDEGRTDDSGDFYCDDCYSERYAYCDYYEEERDSEGFVQVIVGRSPRGYNRYQSWCQDAFANHGFVCDHDGECYSDDLAVHMANGDTCSTYAFEEHGFVCAGDGGNYPIDEAVEVDGELYHRDNVPAGGEDEDTDTDSTEDTATAPAAPVAAPVATNPPGTISVICLYGSMGLTEGKQYLAQHHESGCGWSIVRDDDGDARYRPLDQFALVDDLPIKPGDTVECVKGHVDGHFHIGGRYVVTHVYDDYDWKLISVRADDSGEGNGWTIEHFRRVSAEG